MGVRLVYDERNNRAALYDSVTGFAFGPTIDHCPICGDEANDIAEQFLSWLQSEGHGDARRIDANALEGLLNTFNAGAHPDAPHETED